MFIDTIDRCEVFLLYPQSFAGFPNHFRLFRGFKNVQGYCVAHSAWTKWAENVMLKDNSFITSLNPAARSHVFRVFLSLSFLISFSLLLELAVFLFFFFFLPNLVQNRPFWFTFHVGCLFLSFIHMLEDDTSKHHTQGSKKWNSTTDNSLQYY